MSAGPARPVLSPPVPAEPRPRGRAVELIDRPEDLALHLPAWDDLAARAIEPNPFQEPWMLMPAYRLLGQEEKVVFVLIYLPDRAVPDRPAQLCGLFVLERRRSCRGVPVGTLRFWKHPYSFLQTPLLRRDRAAEALACFLDWLVGNPWSASLAELGEAPAGGPFLRLLDAELERRGRLRHVSESRSRALFRPAGSGDLYLRAGMRRKRRKELARQRRRLGEEGELSVRELQPEDDLDEWIDWFLSLEAGGWKGRSGSALASSPASRAYFTCIAREAFRRRRLMMLGLFVGGRPRAMKCNILAPPGAFAFKIAYDESWSRFSPGLQLEIENVRRLHDRPEIRWMDSCADHDNFMINHLWPHRLLLRTTLLTTGRWPGDLCLSLLPWRRHLRRLLPRRPSRTRRMVSPA